MPLIVRRKGEVMADNVMILLETTSGDILLELFPDKAPKTVENFLRYVDGGFYKNTIFHRVIPNFMIQGGGLSARLEEKETGAPVENEACNGLANSRGAVAMARTGDPHSATAQFYINLVDNDFLNHTAPTPSGWGYCVFGKVVEGMDVVDKIAKVKTKGQGVHENVPVDMVLITDAIRFV
jgi:peptidyl-prolyl cis-trans isomerase B (cyclophilin B)